MTVPREETQRRMGVVSAKTLAHTPGQTHTLGDRLEERARELPEKAWFRFEGREASFAESNAFANRVAHAGRDLGLARGDVAALLMDNRPEYVQTWAGLAKLGVTIALLNPQVRGRALAHALEAVGARHVIAGQESVGALGSLDAESLAGLQVRWIPDPAGAEPATVGEDWSDALAAASTENPDPALRSGLVAGDDLFYMFTSGTTGLPKAARLSHMRYLGVGDAMTAVCGETPDDVIYGVLPLHHGAGGMVVISKSLAIGMTVVLRRRFSVSAFWDEVREQGVTTCQYIGEICRYLMNRPPSESDRGHGLRVMMGAGLGPDIFAAFQERFGIEQIFEGWSSTEANTSLLNVDNVPGSCGRVPFPELHNGRLIRYDVEDDDHPRDANGFCIPCEVGEVGEFVGAIPDLPDSGAGRFEGYTSKEATERKILRGVFTEGDAWYRSGDLLRRDEEDYYYFVDRIGDTFRWKSENVSTQEVAEVLHGFPGLEIANVYGVRVPEAEGRAGMAALVFARDVPFDGSALFTHVSEHLPRYAAPLFLRIGPEADVTHTFKLKKVGLQQDGYDPARVGDPLFVRDDRESAYVPLTPESLERAGILAFRGD